MPRQVTAKIKQHIKDKNRFTACQSTTQMNAQVQQSVTRVGTLTHTGLCRRKPRQKLRPRSSDSNPLPLIPFRDTKALSVCSSTASLNHLLTRREGGERDEKCEEKMSGGRRGEKTQTKQTKPTSCLLCTSESAK